MRLPSLCVVLSPQGERADASPVYVAFQRTLPVFRAGYVPGDKSCSWRAAVPLWISEAPAARQVCCACPCLPVA